jgi:hypothetical protein
MNSLSTPKTFNEMMDKAPQIDSIAARMERLSERRKKLKPATDSEESQMAKLRESEKSDMTALSEKMKASMNPAAMLSGGAPDPAKVQPFMTALMRLNQANLSYDPNFAAAARMTPFGNAGEMPSPGKGGLIAIPPSAAGTRP